MNGIDQKTITITYEVGHRGTPVDGKTLYGGQPYIAQDGTQAVKFDTKYNGKPICMKYAAESELAALVDEYNKLIAQRHAENEARWAAEKAEQDAKDEIELVKMRAEAAELVARIPADHVRVIVEKVGDADGDPILKYVAEGVTLSWNEIEIIGTALAIRPGALGAFASEYVCSISRVKLAEIKAARETEAIQTENRKAASEKELAETPIPSDALACYRRYHGDPEAAWEDGEDTAWAMINKWTPYIEAQYGADPQTQYRLAKEAMREDPNTPDD